MKIALGVLSLIFGVVYGAPKLRVSSVVKIKKNYKTKSELNL